MKLYRGTVSQQPPDGSFIHLGSLMAACVRLESLFLSRNIHTFDGEKFILFTNTGERIGTQRPDEIYDQFIGFAKKAFIEVYSPERKKPLKLQDCWDDDPIGSGGLNIFENFEALPDREKNELTTLFHPFGHTILYPHVIQALLRPSDIQSIINQNKGNALFQKEYAQRRDRSNARGEPWQMVEPFEIVWISLTLKLRSWALENGYSHFEYINKEEDRGHTSHVILAPESIGTPLQTLGLDTKKLKDLAAPRYASFMRAAWESAKQPSRLSGEVYRHVDSLWCGLNPTQFVI